MTGTAPRVIAAGVVALGFAVALMAGQVVATTVPVQPTSSTDVTTDTSPACTDVVALLDAQAQLTRAFDDDDGVAFGAVMESLPGLAASARASAPDEIADQVDEWLVPVDDFELALVDVDLTDIDAVVDALDALPDDESSTDAEVEVDAWATENCNRSGSELSVDAPEPPNCGVLDAAAGADASGVDIDVTDRDGTGDFSLPGFATASCSFGNGALTLSTITFNDLTEVTELFVDLAVDNGGEILDVDLGGLPESTIVSEVDGFITVAVLEAPIPFSIGLGSDDADPATAVAAAEAVLAAQPADGAASATTGVATTDPQGSAPVTSGA